MNFTKFKNLSNNIFRFSLLLGSLLFNSQIFANTTVELSLENQSDFPYIIGTSDSLNTKNPGIAIELLDNLGKKLNIKFKYIRKPWKRCLDDMKNGKTNGCFSASYKKEREKMGVYPKEASGNIDTKRALMESSYAFYKLKNKKFNWDGKNYKQIRAKNIGFIRGYSIGSSLKDNGITNMSEINSLKQALDMLRLQRVDAIAMISTAIDNEISTNKRFANVKKVDPIISTKPYYLMFSKQFYKKNKILCEKIWTGIKEINNSQEFHTISKRYFDGQITK